MSHAAPEGAPPDSAPAPRKPRKIFLLVGIVLAVALGIGLFTTVSTNSNGQDSGGPPAVGGPVPAFTASNLNGSGSVVSPTKANSDGRPTVILFFGKWCQDCHAELPPLASTVASLRNSGGPLARIRVIGVDSSDAESAAKGFIKSSGVTFPVAYDPNTTILAGDFYFRGDPYAVFVSANGRINRIVSGDVLTPTSFVNDERALIPT
jgi:thiol-disulfide isomerase/thioredoxin